MVGRRRRGVSTSTVATVDDDAILFYEENTILKPVSPRAHPDDWPCFLLADATVYHRDGTIANLLHVDLEGPFIIRGRVEVEKDQERFLVNRHLKDRSSWVQIQNTLTFAIGLKDGGLSVPVLWASGGAGWYEIIPSQKYTAMCDHMFQGISLHYAVLDQYEQALEKLHKKKKNRSKTIQDVKLPLDNLLFQYALTVGDGVTLPEAYQRCREQATFLLSHFPNGTEFHDWLSSEFPDLRQKLVNKQSSNPQNVNSTKPTPLIAVPYTARDMSSSVEISDRKPKGIVATRNSAARSTRSSEPADIESVDLSGDDLQRRSRSARTTGKSTAPNRTESAEQADIDMIDLSEDKSTQGRARKRNSLRVPTDTPGQLAPQNSGDNDVDSNINIAPSTSIIIYVLNKHRALLLQALKEGGKSKHPDDTSPKTWQNKIYLDCSIKYSAAPEVFQYHARDLAHFLGPEWHQSQLYQWTKEHENDVPKFEHISEADIKRISLRAKMQHTASRGDQSSKGSKQPEPVAAHSGKLPRRGRPSGKAAGLRPSIGSKKRPYREADSEDEMDLDEYGSLNTGSKKSRYLSDDENDEEAQDAASSDRDEQADDKDQSVGRVVIRAEKLPSTTPRGPDNTWTCEEPGCEYVVRAADTEEGQELIGVHYEEHEKEARDVAEEAALNRVNLAVQESRGHLPINHLLDKIRSLGDKPSQQRGGDDAGTLNGEPIPQPIKRTLLV
ncbi:hypothetical protein F4809DRAFT_629383 [Biscogniauxia mediterranea]|nr:hypothetical protein F4809DRAFT_629383 [Biscogniauxia mediterranea]